jgi:hypothetical protein
MRAESVLFSQWRSKPPYQCFGEHQNKCHDKEDYVPASSTAKSDGWRVVGQDNGAGTCTANQKDSCKELPQLTFVAAIR